MPSPTAEERRKALPQVDVRVGDTVDETVRKLVQATLAHYKNRRKQDIAACLGVGLRTLGLWERKWARESAQAEPVPAQ